MDMTTEAADIPLPEAAPDAAKRSIRQRLADVIDDLRRNPGGPPMDWRTLTVLLVTPVLLTVFYYFGRPEYFRREHMDLAEQVLGASNEYLGLAPFGFWAVSSLVLRVLLPAIIILAILRHSLRDYGFRIKGTLRHAPLYFLMLLAVMPLVYMSSTQDSFLAKYPFYRDAALGGWHLWAYEAFYFIQFFSLEFFFRGFLIFGLYRRFGYYSVIIMTIPYCMIHFNKPFTETLGAIVAGFILGVLALRSGSFLLGVLLHFAVALAMDLLALYQLGLI